MAKNKSEKMYSKSPKLDRDEKGNVSITHPKETDVEQSGTAGVSDNLKEQHAMRDMHHRHEMEHMAMNRKHEVEHAASKGGDGMLEKHISEHKEMNTRHIGELKKAVSRKNSNDEGADPKQGKTKLEEPKAEKKPKATDGGVKE